MRITFVIPSLQCGGAERTLAMMANYWAAREKEITILTFESKEAAPFYDLTKNITVLPLNIFSSSEHILIGLLNNIRRLLVLRTALKSSRPDVIISFMIRTNVRVLIASTGLHIPVIASDRTDPFFDKPGRAWNILVKATYPLAAGVTVFTQHLTKYFPTIIRKKLRVIPNPVVIENNKIAALTENKRLIAVGSLEHIKGFDILITAFAKVREIFPAATLTIWGEGSQRRNLEAISAELKLSDQIFLPGITKDMVGALLAADLFIQTSRYEGFGNALCEAMAVGLPVIATSCSGPQEIIRDGIDGILVPVENVDLLANAIIDLLSNSDKRRALATKAIEITGRFNLEAIMKQWEILVEEVAN